MSKTREVFSAPTVINLEITDVCNIKCRHCYNYWREENDRKQSLTRERFDQLVDMFVDAGVFHVVLTGGEPFSRFDILEYGFRKLVDNGISISCNSNLMLATDDNIKRLADTGLDHILTSLNSHDPVTNDYMVNRTGAFQKIVRGIETAVRNGIRVSANMIVSQRNKDHVYETGRFAHSLGCQKIFGTRTVPSVNLERVNGTDFQLTREDALHTLNQLVRVKEDTGIMIGTLVSYPLCLLGDLERFRDFVGRGCPAQSGHVMSLNASGDSHACVHEEQPYGNVFEIGIRKAYQNMQAWHDGSYQNPACAGCDYIAVCSTGCRMSAHSYFGDHRAADNLMVNKHAFLKPYKITQDETLLGAIDPETRFIAPKRLRFRKESGYYLLNVRWANTITCPEEVAEYLIARRNDGASFTLKDIGLHHKDTVTRLYFKDAIEGLDIRHSDQRNLLGLSADLPIGAS